MPPKHAHDTDGFELRSPHTLTLKDLITIVSVAISLAIAWGVFDTRITVLEKELVAQTVVDVKETSDIAEINVQLRKLQSKVQDNQRSIDELYRTMHKPLPRRADDGNN